MHSRRSIVLVALVGLSVLASMTRPWVHGSGLLASKYSDAFSYPYFGLDAPCRAVDDSFHREFDTEGIHSIQVEAGVGEITVTSAHGNRISIDGELVAHGPSDQIARERLRHVSLDAVQDGGTVRVVGSAMRPEPSSPDAPSPTEGLTNMVLRVPSGLAVTVQATAGTVRLHDLRGTIEAHVRMGSIEATSVTGNLTITTSAGRIAVTNATIERQLKLSTSMGDITFDGSLGKQNYVASSAGKVRMTVPRSTCVRLEAVTDAGKVNTDLPVTERKSEAMTSSAFGILGQGEPTGDLEIRVSIGDISIVGR
ncbi:MAG: DUF4097 family beta strand repeat-containing protein [Limnochordia bacterium]|jgi:hypothetical protein